MLSNNSLLNKRQAVLNAQKSQYNTQQDKNANFFEKTFDTIGDFFGNAFSGTAKAIEGIYDSAASVVGAIGGIFDKDFQNKVKDHVAYDWVGNNITNPINNYFDDSLLNNNKVGNFIENVASGVGQMLPSVVMNALVPGSGMAVLGISATGNATESAFNDGASYGQGIVHGLVSGGIEVATEKLGGKLFGNSVVDKALGLKPTNKTLFKGAPTKLGKFVQEAVGEGIEEGMSELLSPLSKTIYKDTDALKEYGDKDYWKGVGNSFLVGTATSAAFGGTVGKLYKNTVNANETLQELKTLDIKEEDLHASNELFNGDTQTKIDNLRNKLQSELSENVVKMNEKTRAKFIQQNNLGAILNEDGTLKTRTINNGQDVQLNKNEANKTLASGINRYMSVGLKGQEQDISKRLQTQGVNIYNGELTTTEKDNYTKFKKSMLALSRKGLVRSNFVISDESINFDAYLDGNTIVVGKNMFESDEWQKKLIHEVEHFTEGSKEWFEFAEFVMNETNLSKANEGILSKKYGITQLDIDTLAYNLKNNSITEKQKLYISEVIATQSEFIFGNEEMLNRLTHSNRNLVQKILDKIKNFIRVLKSKTPEEKSFIQKLQKAESLFERALSKAGTDYLINQSFDTNGELIYNDAKYARKSYAKLDVFKITRQSYNHHAWATNEITGILSLKEISAFNSVISDIQKGHTFNKTLNGDYIVEVGDYLGGERTTIIITDGKFNEPSIEAVIDIYVNDVENIKKIKEFIYERAYQTYDYRELEESFGSYGNINEKTGFREYTLESGISFEEFSKQRENGRDFNSDNQSIKNGTRDDSKIQFSLKNHTKFTKKVQYIPYSKIGEGNVGYIKNQLLKLYDGYDNCVADGIAIENEDEIFIIDSGSENSEICFGVRRKKIVSDKQLRKEFIYGKNRESLSKGYISDELSERFENEFCQYPGRDLQREFGKELSIDNGKSADNQEGIFRQDADNRRGRLKYSLSNQSNSKDKVEYSKREGDSINGTQQRRNLHSDYSEKWNESKDTSKQIGRLQEGSRESRQRENRENERKVKRLLPTKEKTARRVKIRQVEHSDWSEFEKKLAKTINEELGVNIEFYEGSAIPPNVEASEVANFDGFMDSKNNIMYLRSDSTLTDAEIIEASKHESVHHIKAIKPELYESVANAIMSNMDIHDWNKLFNIYAENYAEVYGDENPDKIYEEIVADIVSRRIQANFANVEDVNIAIEEMYKSFNTNTKSKAIKSGELKYSLSNNRNAKKINTYWGSGYNVHGINTKEYNLINFKNKTQLEMFSRQLNGLEKIIKENNNQDFQLRINIFNTLQKQKNNVYSKLLEINKALSKTKTLYKYDNSIDIKKTFIENLGYNGILVNEGSSQSFESVIYDLDKKRNDLFDYSQDRAKERLDKAIKLFGETKQPEKAGWLLTDGRLVDYNRDSSNILSSGDSFVLDYQDHWQIEKVYDSKRGTDAIDSFMAEGNIRLMPEIGGIELRNIPNSKQFLILKDYIEKLINSEYGITIDLRLIGSNENTLPNYVHYDSDTSVNKIINDIKSYYNNDGYIPRVVGGKKYSLKSNNTYTESQYNNYGWAMVNNVLTGQQWYDFNQKLASLSNKQSTFIKTANGEYIIPINNMIAENFGVDNVLVYVNSNYQNPHISKIIKINLFDETSIEYVRSFIYENERRTNNQTSNAIKNIFGEELISELSSQDFPSYQEFRRQGEDGGENSKPNEQVGIRDNARFRKNVEYNLPEEEIKYSLSKGQVAKNKANYTKMKVYSRGEAELLINDILGEQLLIDNMVGTIKGITKQQAITKMFEALNLADEGYRAKMAGEISDYIIENAVYENIFEDRGVDYEVMQQYDILKRYRGKLDLSNLKSEIYNHFDTNLGKAIIMQWGKKNGGLGVDDIAQELIGNGINIEAINEADIFFEIVDNYNYVVSQLKKSSEKIKSNSFSPTEIKDLKQNLIREILLGYDKYGVKSKFANTIDKYINKIRDLKTIIKENQTKYFETNNLLYKVQKIKDWKVGRFISSSTYKPDIFKNSIEQLSRINNRGNLNKNGTRKIISGLNDWYSIDNLMLGYSSNDNTGYYVEEVKNMLNTISNGKGNLDLYEIKTISKIVDYFEHLVKTYNKVYINGQYKDAMPIAKEYIDKMHVNKNLYMGPLTKVFDNVFNNKNGSYMQTFSDPMSVARYMDKYDNGFFTHTLSELREAAVNAEIMEMNIKEPLDVFLKTHKNFTKENKKKIVKYNGYDLPIQKAYLLYMTLNRDQALVGLANSGFVFEDDKGVRIRVSGFNTDKSENIDDIRQQSEVVKNGLYAQFNESDKEYISIIEKIFNEDCKQAKIKTDVIRKGYTNTIDGYYVPIKRANIVKQIDNSIYDEIDRVSNASFNKNTVNGAKGELFIDNLDSVCRKHLTAVSQYANLSTVIDQFDMLYNLNIDENNNKPISVKTESDNTWKKGYNYIKKLINDIQGISSVNGGFNKIVGFLRGSYAKYQLGANPKVWLTQLSSFFASSSMLDYSSILKGIAIDTSDVDNYCQLAKLRNYDNTVAMAQGVFDNIDKVGDFLMKPINKVDRYVIRKLFGACQVQVEKENGVQIGTEENKIKAGELLKQVILETQQNSVATERSSAMRSGSEFFKAITMFTADSMKVFGRFVDAIGERFVLNAKLKNTNNTKDISDLKNQIKICDKKIIKSATSLTLSAVFMALIAQGFKWLYNKDDEDENKAVEITMDAIGNMMGGLPLIKDVYARFTDKYSINNYAYSAINDLLNSISNISNINSNNAALNVKNLINAVGQILGISTRNIYNILYGLTSKISPSTGYKIDDLFYNKNYSKDLQKAIENNDDNMVSTITGIMLKERIGLVKNTQVQNEIDRLVKNNFNVLPKSLKTSVDVNGETIDLNKNQRNKLMSTYLGIDESLNSLIQSNTYSNLSDVAKTKAINYIYDYYYQIGLANALEIELNNKLALFGSSIDISKLSEILGYIKTLESEKDKNGNTIQGSLKNKIVAYLDKMNLTANQKYMIMGYLGYKNLHSSNTVKSYIQSLKLNKNEKEKLYAFCGY